MHGLAIFSDASIALSTRFPSSTNKSLEEIGHSDKSQSEKSTGIDFFCASLCVNHRITSVNDKCVYMDFSGAAANQI